jgi:hypothetical protein
LKWVHVFAASERWKEELLRTGEEIRRLAAWHDYKVRFFDEKAASQEVSEQWADRGLHALHNELSQIWRNRRENLPDLVRGTSTPLEGLYQFADEDVE